MKSAYRWSILLAALVSIGAHADDTERHWYSGLYFGGGIGAGRMEANLGELGLLPQDTNGVREPIESNSFKDTPFDYKIFAGYRLSRYFAVEAGYTDMDDVERQFCFIDSTTGQCSEQRRPGSPPSAPVISSSAWTVQLPTSGWTAYAVGIYPFNDTVEIFAKFGVIAWEADVIGYEKIVGGYVPVKPPLVPPTNVAVSQSIDGTDAAAGLGVSFNHPSGVTIRTEAEYFDISEFDRSYTFTVSALYNF